MSTTNFRTVNLYHLYGNGFLFYANAWARANQFVISYAAAVANFTLGPASAGPRSTAAEAPHAETGVDINATVAAPGLTELDLAAAPRETFEAAPSGETADLGALETEISASFDTVAQSEPAQQTLAAEPSEFPVASTPPLVPADEVPRKASASSSKRETSRNRRRKK